MSYYTEYLTWTADKVASELDYHTRRVAGHTARITELQAQITAGTARAGYANREIAFCNQEIEEHSHWVKNLTSRLAEITPAADTQDAVKLYAGGTRYHAVKSSRVVKGSTIYTTVCGKTGASETKSTGLVPCQKCHA